MATTKKSTGKSGSAKKSTASKADKKAPETTESPVVVTPPVIEDTAKKDAEIDALKKQVAQMQAQLEAASKPQIIQMAADTARVSFLWQAEVANDNVISFGDGGMYGRIVGKTGTFSCPKSEMSRLLDSANRYYLDRRWLIVLDGLDEEEREMLGVNYKEGELLDRKAFAKMVEMEEGILDIYPILCASHREMVAKRYNEAFAARNHHVKRDVVVALNRMSKAAGSVDGDFQKIIKAMNAEDEE